MHPSTLTVSKNDSLFYSPYTAINIGNSRVEAINGFKLLLAYKYPSVLGHLKQTNSPWMFPILSSFFAPFDSHDQKERKIRDNFVSPQPFSPSILANVVTLFFLPNINS